MPPLGRGAFGSVLDMLAEKEHHGRLASLALTVPPLGVLVLERVR